MSAKWLKLLKQVAPSVTRVGVFRASAFPTGIGQFAAIQAVASSFGVELRPIDARDAGEIESAVTAFAHGANGGLIVTSNPLMTLHLEPIIALAARLRLPAVYSSGHFVTRGGLASYGPTPSTSSGARPATLIASSKARSQPSCRCRHRPSTKR
jgi:putative tryptophan/tyrosine transport system substrate-binding protein